MFIGIDASRLAASQRTGTENYAFQITGGLLKLASQQHRFILYFNKPPSSEIRHHFELCGRVEFKVIPLPRLWTHLRLSRELVQHPPQRLFVPAHVLPVFHPGSSVVTVHDLGYLYYPDSHTANSRRYLELSTRFSARQARRIIAISQATRLDLNRHYGISDEKIEVVYHGYDQQRFHPVEDPVMGQAVRARHGLGPGRFLLYVGTLQPRKNLLRLLAAFEAIKDEPEFNDVQLVLGGKPGWLSQPIIERAERWPGRVILAGYVPDTDLPALLNAASAFVFPSLYEGFGMPVLEALACGCPVVCSNSSSLPEVAGTAALYHHPLDTGALVACLRQVLTRPELAAQLRRQGPLQAAGFSWERCVEQTWQVLMRA